MASPVTTLPSSAQSVSADRMVMLSITCSRLETRLIRLKDRSFYDIINNKLRHYD